MNEEMIDRQAFETLKSMTDPAFLIELIDVFLDDTPDQIEQMRAGIAAGNLDQIRRAAHSLKSNSASFGAERLSALSRELEMIAKSSAPGEMTGAVPTSVLESAGLKLGELSAEYNRLVPVLQEIKNGL